MKYANILKKIFSYPKIYFGKIPPDPEICFTEKPSYPEMFEVNN